MNPRQPRVPVRWGFVIASGIVVFGILGAVAYYGAGSVSTADALSVVKRVLPARH